MTPNEALARLGELVPAEAVRRGWGLGGLMAAPDGRWSVNVLGPASIDATEHAYGGPELRRTVTHRWMQGVIGTIYAYDVDDLVAQVAAMLEALVGPPDR